MRRVGRQPPTGGLAENSAGREAAGLPRRKAKTATEQGRSACASWRSLIFARATRGYGPSGWPGFRLAVKVQRAVAELPGSVQRRDVHYRIGMAGRSPNGHPPRRGMLFELRAGRRPEVNAGSWTRGAISLNSTAPSARTTAPRKARHSPAPRRSCAREPWRLPHGHAHRDGRWNGEELFSCHSRRIVAANAPSAPRAEPTTLVEIRQAFQIAGEPLSFRTLSLPIGGSDLGRPAVIPKRRSKGASIQLGKASRALNQ